MKLLYNILYLLFNYFNFFYFYVEQIVLRGLYTNMLGFVFEIHEGYTNISLHFKPQDDADGVNGFIVLNHMIQGEWNVEYLPQTPVFPFTLGQTFIVHILARKDSFAIFVDGSFVCSYQYVIPLNRARYFFFEGNVQFLQISV